MAERDHLDPANNELPNLSTWHRVPVGATIPAGTPYAYVRQNCVTLGLGGAYAGITVDRDGAYYTEHPIGLPLPTEEGATILVSSDELPPYILVTLVEGSCWVTRYGAVWYVDQIASWAPITIGETVVMQCDAAKRYLDRANRKEQSHE